MNRRIPSGQHTIVEPRSEWSERFEAADCPTDLRALDGYLDGVVVAGPATLTRSPLTRRLSESRLFESTVDRALPLLGRVWLGVAWKAEGPWEALGAHRLVWIGGERQVAPFRCLLEGSRIDGRPCVVWEYVAGDVPGPLSRFRGEMRRTAPDSYLCLTTVRIRGAERAWSWVTLSPRRPATTTTTAG